MIHAYLFVTNNDKDREGHGPEFCKHMHRINRLTGANITVYKATHIYDIQQLFIQHFLKIENWVETNTVFEDFPQQVRGPEKLPGLSRTT